MLHAQERLSKRWLRNAIGNNPITSPALVCVMLIALMISPPSLGWWALGHAAMCASAWDQIRDDTRTAIQQLNGREPFTDACTWADRIRSERKHTADWHYLNVPPGMPAIDNHFQPASGQLLSALKKQRALLCDPSTVHAKRVEALKWVAHLIGDLHQPLHLGFRDDLGGNKYAIRFNEHIGQQLGETTSTRTNMHRLWDGQLLIYEAKRRHRSIDQLVRESRRPATGEPLAWVNQTLSILRQPSTRYAYGDRIKTLHEDYLRQQAPIAVTQLQFGASRLARVLDQCLGSASR